MPSIGTLWTVPRQRTGKVILAVAALGGLEVDLPADYTHYKDNLEPPFLSKFPHGKIPAYESKDGFKLFEGAAIAKYIASLAPNANLLGGDPKELALVEQWIHFSDTEVDTPSYLILQLLRATIPYNKSFHALLLERLTRSLNTLNKHLATRTFLVYERISLADIIIAAAVQQLVSIIVDADLRSKLPNLIRHMETVVNQQKIKEIFGETEYCEKAQQFTPPAKEKKEKEPKPAAAAPAPKSEKKPKAKAAEEDHDEEPLIPEEPKAKNPLDLLPKSTMVFDDWKRAYSNKETRGTDGAIDWFYKNFDKEGFSVWRVDFKYNQELTQIFMSSNQIGGFFNRLEASRKYLFGSVGVFGTANNSVITGVFICRGQDIKPVVEVAPDVDSYDYKRLDIENADDKAFFEGCLAWDLEVDGKQWADGKIFK